MREGEGGGHVRINQQVVQLIDIEQREWWLRSIGHVISTSSLPASERPSERLIDGRHRFSSRPGSLLSSLKKRANVRPFHSFSQSSLPTSRRAVNLPDKQLFNIFFLSFCLFFCREGGKEGRFWTAVLACCHVAAAVTCESGGWE